MLQFRKFCKLNSLSSVRLVFQSKQFALACKDLPLTPSGKNPYDVLELTVSQTTNLDDVSKQFRSMVVQNHPDKPGGSTEKMSEINLAYKIVKENHDLVLRKLKEVESATQATEAYRQRSTSRVSRDEELGRRGGLHRQRPVVRPTIRRKMYTEPPSSKEYVNGYASSKTANGYGEERSSQSFTTSSRPRPLREVAEHWTKFREELDDSIKSMSNRYELAVQIGSFLKKTTALGEVTARERWLRRSYIKALWEDVHELRAELLRHGTRSAQHSELAEEMVQVASNAQRKIDEDFQRTTQKCVNSQAHIYFSRLIKIVFIGLFIVAFCKNLGKMVMSNTISARYRSAILT